MSHCVLDQPNHKTANTTQQKSSVASNKFCVSMLRGHFQQRTKLETGFYTPPPLEVKIVTDTLARFSAPVVYTISGPIGEGMLYTTGAVAENVVVKISKTSVPALYKNQSPTIRYEKTAEHKVFGRDIPGISRTKTLCKWPFSVVLDREWPGCPGIWVGTSRIWKNFMQENFGLIFRTLHKRGVKTDGFQNRKSCTWELSKIAMLVHQQFWCPFGWFFGIQRGSKPMVFIQERHGGRSLPMVARNHGFSRARKVRPVKCLAQPSRKGMLPMVQDLPLNRGGELKPMVFKMASSVNVQFSQFWCTSNFGTVVSEHFRRQRDDNKIKFALFGGGGALGQRGKSSKTLFLTRETPQR